MVTTTRNAVSAKGGNKRRRKMTTLEKSVGWLLGPYEDGAPRRMQGVDLGPRSTSSQYHQFPIFAPAPPSFLHTKRDAGIRT